MTEATEQNPLKRIYWLASYPKSGNTWVRMFLNAYVSGFPVRLNSAFQFASGDLMPQWYQLTAAKAIGEMDDPASLYYRPAVLMNHLATAATRAICLKTHHAKIECDGIPLIPPRLSLGALYIVRDPRDVVISFADHCGVSIDEAVGLMANDQQTISKDDSKLYHVLTSWSSHVDSWTVNNKGVNAVTTAVVRYEDMVDDPDRQFRLIVDALHLGDFDDDRFRFALNETQFNRLSDAEDDGGFRETGKGAKFFRRGKAGGWRDTLTSKQVERIEANHRHAMERWGYEPAAKARKPYALRRVQSAAAGTVSD